MDLIAAPAATCLLPLAATLADPPPAYKLALPAFLLARVYPYLTGERVLQQHPHPANPHGDTTKNRRKTKTPCAPQQKVRQKQETPPARDGLREKKPR